MFTKVLARELSLKGIRVNCLNPGVVRSNLPESAGLFTSDAEYEGWISDMVGLHPLGRIGMPADIVAAVRFLVSSDASWITGASIAIDGVQSGCVREGT